MKPKEETEILCSGPCAQAVEPEIPTDGSSVSALVTKSKKAAASLFTLLHAKNCKLGVHRCPHPGCAEAKLIYLHLKTSSCNIGDVGACPTNHKGCADSRKLLNHYRRCREIRSRQVTNRSREPQHICLVCSLVARHAKGSIDRNRSTSPNVGRTCHLIPTLNLSTDQKCAAYTHPRQRSRSTSPPRGEIGQSPMKMPPPPPKFSLTNLVEKPDVNTTFLLGSVGKISGRKREMDVKHRPRADSLEILRSSRDTDWYLKKAHSDPISFSPEVNVEKAEKSQEEPVVHQRRRSASCSVPSSSSPSTTGATFDPILEEPVGNELQRILEGDS